MTVDGWTAILLLVFALLLVALGRRWHREARKLTPEQIQRDQAEAAYMAAYAGWRRARSVPAHPLERSLTPEWLRQATDRFEPSQKSQGRRP